MSNQDNNKTTTTYPTTGWSKAAQRRSGRSDYNEAREDYGFTEEPQAPGCWDCGVIDCYDC